MRGILLSPLESAGLLLCGVALESDLLWQSVGAERTQAPSLCWEGARQKEDTCSLLSNGQMIAELEKTKDGPVQDVPVGYSSSLALNLLWRGVVGPPEASTGLAGWKSLRLSSSHFCLRPSPPHCLPGLERGSYHGFRDRSHAHILSPWPLSPLAKC